MYDIIFDFSSSPERGGLRRLVAYLRYFENKNLNVLFLVSSRSGLKDRTGKVEVRVIEKGVFQNALLISSYLKKYVGSARWFFSYGIPITMKVGQRNWLHISNVLPFYIGRCTLGMTLTLKMALRRWQFGWCAFQHDVYSAESQNSINEYRRITKASGRPVVLGNSSELDGAIPTNLKKEPYAIVLGTTSYKRVDQTYELFRMHGEKLGIKRLRIVGQSKNILRRISDDPTVEIVEFIPERDLVFALATAKYFISSSEVENSPTAALEGIAVTGSAILRKIPAIVELLGDSDHEEIDCNGVKYVLLESRRQLSLATDVSWSQIVEKMLDVMNSQLSLQGE